jgi:hypothetical protein
MKRRIKLKITKIQQQTTRLAAGILRARCPVCAREVETLAVAHAYEVLAIDAETFNGLVAAGQVHVIETVSGSLWVCKDSLFARE